MGSGGPEEIDFQPATSRGGENYGWNIMEGTRCLKPDVGCDTTKLTLPIAEYRHDLGCVVTGGFRYRGRAMPVLAGHYIFGDYCSGRIWALAQNGQGGWTRTELLYTKLGISSFGEDERGELYVMDISGGKLYRLGARKK